MAAAQASHCAGDQDAYWPMDMMLFDNAKPLGEESLPGYAAQLDGEAFSTCLASDRHLQSISICQFFLHIYI
jgi:protein-disulfide isomerase